MEANYPVTSFVQIKKEILNPRSIMRVRDLGMVQAYLSNSGYWVQLYDSYIPTGCEVLTVRAVQIESGTGNEDTVRYFDEEAEKIWDYFSKIAYPLLLEDLTLDNNS